MRRRSSRIIEGVVTAAIVLVLVHTFVEDFAVLRGWSWPLRRWLLILGGVFDLFFTVEFILRSWAALSERRFWRYIVRENGWVDFVASVPLLVMTSGPAVWTLFTGGTFAGAGAMLGVLKVIKAVRMARVLRLLRLLKIFRRIKFADSPMVQRHSVRIITTATSALIFSVTIIGAVFAYGTARDLEEAWIADQRAATESLEANPDLASGPDTAEAWGRSRPAVMLLKDRDWTLFAREDDATFRRFFGPGDYLTVAAGNYEIWFDTRPAAVNQARQNITVFLSALAVVILLMVTYSPHFAITVTDPINVMSRGLDEKSYNLEVVIPELRKDDDVFRLARSYNEEFLPLKERCATEEDVTALDIKLDDISDLLDG